VADLTAWARVANEARNNHGGTYDSGACPVLRRSGYWVGGKRPGVTLSRSVTLLHLSEALRDFAAGLSEGEYAGLWFDGGLVYLDVAEWWADFETAARVARERGELAVYACAAGREVRL
jgi:hypothetical protein